MKTATKLGLLSSLYLSQGLPYGFFTQALPVLLEPPRTAARWAIVVATALVATAAAYFVFERYLHVLLPRGRWTDF